MSYTVDTTATVREDHTVTFTVPEDVPLGKVRIIATVEASAVSDKMTAQDLANSEFFGDWADRDDLPRTNEEFTEWRRKLWERPRE